MAHHEAGGPPPELVRSLVEGPSLVTAVEWHERIDSTNRRVRHAAAGGTAAGLLVLADEQTAGRGRRGRGWTAPPGTSLMLTLLVREDPARLAGGLLPLAVGVALHEAVVAHLAVAEPPAHAGLKWPNDLLVAAADGPWRKAAGILVERVADAAAVGVGVNVDWRGVERPAELAGATSLAEAVGGPVDRWRLLAGLAGVLTNRLADWRADPDGVRSAYRAACATIGARVRATLPDGTEVRGSALDVAADGALVLDTPDGPAQLHAADVVHLDGGG